MSSDVNSNPVSVALSGDDRHAGAELPFHYLTVPNSREEISAWLGALAKDDSRDERSAPKEVGMSDSSKVIQIAVMRSSEDNSPSLFALTEDGEIYCQKIGSGVWKRLRSPEWMVDAPESTPVPEEETAEPTPEEEYEAQKKLKELLATPVSDPAKFTRCVDCGAETPKWEGFKDGDSGICNNCIPF